MVQALGIPGPGQVSMSIRRGKTRGILRRCATGEGPRLPAISAYFETDFLNMRSIFSFVASQHCWLF
jgi:hypothetical protein